MNFTDFLSSNSLEFPLKQGGVSSDIAAVEKRKRNAPKNANNSHDSGLLKDLVLCARCDKRGHKSWQAISKR